MEPKIKLAWAFGGALVVSSFIFGPALGDSLGRAAAEYLHKLSNNPPSVVYDNTSANKTHVGANISIERNYCTARIELMKSGTHLEERCHWRLNDGRGEEGIEYDFPPAMQERVSDFVRESENPDIRSFDYDLKGLSDPLVISLFCPREGDIYNFSTGIKPHPYCP